jgi:hypothetical protein
MKRQGIPVLRQFRLVTIATVPIYQKGSERKAVKPRSLVTVLLLAVVLAPLGSAHDLNEYHQVCTEILAADPCQIGLSEEDWPRCDPYCRQQDEDVPP